MRAIYLILLTFWTLNSWAQNGIDVYECGAVNAPVTQAEIDANYSYYGACVQFDEPTTYFFDQTDNHLVIGGKGIDIEPGFTAENLTAGGAMTLELCSDLKDVRAFEVADLGAVEALKKFEVGVELPAEIMQRVQAFISTGDTSGNQINPYLSWHLEAKAYFVHRATQFEKVVHGFYFQDFERDTNYANVSDWTWDTVPTTHPFRFRYAPELTGQWDVFIEVLIDGTDYLVYCPFAINVTPNTSDDGFVKVAANNKMLERNGELFFAVGQNLPWPRNDALNGVPVGDQAGFFGSEIVCAKPFVEYEEMMEEYKEKGTNFFRMILNSSTTEIEFEEVGNYTKRLHCGWEVDQIIEKAEELDLYIHFNMLLHDYFDNKNLFYGFNWDWGDDPVALKAPSQYEQSYAYRSRFNLGNDESYRFLTDAGCKKYYKERVRYLIGRYGYSPHVAVFELLSEMNNIGSIYQDNVVTNTIYDSLGNPIGTSQSLEMSRIFDGYEEDSQQPLRAAAWHDEMAKYVKNELGHTQHLLSVSYTGLPDSTDYSYDIPEVDIVTWNQYNSSVDKFHNLPESVRLRHVAHKKPILWSETGPLGEYACDNGLTYKKDCWKNSFTGIAGFEIWNGGLNNGDPEHWKHLKMVQDFVQNNDTINRLFMSDNWNQVYRNDIDNVQPANRKDMVGIGGTYLDATGTEQKAMVGVVSNLTYNYYSNRDLNAINWCATNIPDKLIQEQKINTSQAVSPLYFTPIILGNYTYRWYDSEANYLLTNQLDSTNYAVIPHPMSCVTDTCAQLLPELPFVCTYEYIDANKHFDPIEPSNTEVAASERQEAFKVFPNPNRGRINVICSDPSVVRVVIQNAQGQQVNEHVLNAEEDSIELTNLESGIYVILAIDRSNQIKYRERCVKL